MKIDGIELDRKQATFYAGLKKKNPMMAKAFLSDLAKRAKRAKEVLEDVVTRCSKDRSDPAVLKCLDNRGVHNFSLGCLDAYFYLGQYLEDGRAFLYKDRILILPARTGGYKVFAYKTDPEDLPVLRELQKVAIIYSIDPIPGLPKGSSFHEVAYDIAEIFNPNNYKNTKKRYAALKYPFNWLSSHGMTVEPLSFDNEAECAALHEKWVEHKLADPRTFQMMFPRRRYQLCVEKATGTAPNPLGVVYKGYAVRLDGQLSVVRVLHISGETAYDLAFFANTWDSPSHSVNYINTFLMRDLLDSGIRFFNCGASLNKNLQTFKEAFPNYSVESFMYRREKE